MSQWLRLFQRYVFFVFYRARNFCIFFFLYFLRFRSALLTDPLIYKRLKTDPHFSSGQTRIHLPFLFCCLTFLYFWWSLEVTVDFLCAAVKIRLAFRFTSASVCPVKVRAILSLKLNVKESDIFIAFFLNAQPRGVSVYMLLMIYLIDFFFKLTIPPGEESVHVLLLT